MARQASAGTSLRAVPDISATTETALRGVLLRIERDPTAVFREREVRSWPHGLLNALADLGILRKPRLSTRSIGNPLAAHSFDLAATADREFRALLNQWQPDRERLAGWLCAELGLKPTPAPIVPKRLYRMGIISSDRTPRAVLVAYGLSQAWSFDLMARITDQSRQGAIIVMPAAMPVPGFWSLSGIVWLSLAELIQWERKRRRLDTSMLVKAIRARPRCHTGR